MRDIRGDMEAIADRYAVPIAEVMASFKMTMEAKDPILKMRSKFERPSPCARVDNTGVSPEMRALLQQRYG